MISIDTILIMIMVTIIIFMKKKKITLEVQKIKFYNQKFKILTQFPKNALFIQMLEILSIIQAIIKHKAKIEIKL